MTEQHRQTAADTDRSAQAPRSSAAGVFGILLLVVLLVAPTLLLLRAGDDGSAADSVERPGFPVPGNLSEATVWAVGDGAEAGRSGAPVAAMIEDDDPDLLLYLGDVYETGTAEEFAENYEPTYGRLKPVTLPTPGNHEWPNAAEGYLPYWADVANGGETPSYYATEVAGWELISVNSEAPHGPGSAQARWLERQAAGGGNCRLVFTHRPRFGAGHHGDLPDMAPVWNRVVGKARLFIAGHDHNMQRLKPIDGIVALISGAGGRERYGVRRRDPRLAFSEDGTNGALRLRLSPGVARWSFVTVEGRLLDKGMVRCG